MGGRPPASKMLSGSAFTGVFAALRDEAEFAKGRVAPETGTIT